MYNFINRFGTQSSNKYGMSEQIEWSEISNMLQSCSEREKCTLLHYKVFLA
jgi:hypothetical protein